MATRIYTRTSRNNGYNNRLIEEMQNESARLLQDFRDQLAQEITRQLTQITNAASNTTSSGLTDDNGNVYAGLFSTAIRYLVRPLAVSSSQESSRSAAAQQEFRLSQSQAAAQASSALATAQKNS